MGRVEKSIEIKARPEKVWEMLALDRHPELNPSDKSVKYTSKVDTPKEKYRVGASAHVTQDKEEFDIEITESLENEKIAYCIQGIRGVRNLAMMIILKPIEEGTRVTAVSDYEMSNLVMKMFNKLVSKALEKDFEKSLNNLKSVLEK